MVAKHSHSSPADISVILLDTISADDDVRIKRAPAIRSVLSVHFIGLNNFCISGMT